MSPPPVKKKGLGIGAILGIGCGAILLIGVIIAVVATMMLGPKIKEFAGEMQKNPARATASLMVSASGGAIEMVAEDDVNKRYTVKETKTGKLTTIYWDQKKNAPEVIQGDFSAIPAEPDAGASAPAPAE